MTDIHLYQPQGSEWERMPSDLSTAVEQWWEEFDEPFERTQVFEERSCEKVPMPDLDWFMYRLAEDITDDTFLEHDDLKAVETLLLTDPEIRPVSEALWSLIHSKIDYWQAGKVERLITVRAWPTGGHGWDWEIVE